MRETQGKANCGIALTDLKCCLVVLAIYLANSNGAEFQPSNNQ